MNPAIRSILFGGRRQLPPAEIMAQFANAEKGCILIPSLSRYVFQDSAKTIQAVVGGSVAKLVCPATGVEATFSNVTLQVDASGSKYLAANGTSSNGATSSIDFTGTDKMTVTAGIYKASDAAAAIFAELSTSATSVAGSFAVLAPAAASTTVGLYLRGDTATNVNAFTSVAAPIAYVHTGVFDIAQAAASAESVGRLNGVSQASPGTAAGAGNFSNNPIYIFARAGASLFFSGRMYGLIARGATSSAGQIADAERYMARLTGVSF